MTSSDPTTVTTDAAPRTPSGPAAARPLRHGQARLLWGCVLLFLGAVTPWVATVAGSILGVRGGGTWTLAAAGIGLATIAYRGRRILLVHAAVVAAVPLVIVTWQAGRLVSLGCDLRGCAPSYGLVPTAAGGLLALGAFRRLLADRSVTGAPPARRDATAGG